MIAEAVMCMALNLYHEARSESITGMIAVGNVVMNRVKSPRYPDNVCDVIYQKKNNRKYQCQFTWYCDGLPDKPLNQVAWAQSVSIARLVVNGQVFDQTKGATHYHATYVKPKWASVYKRTVKIGYHIFYKNK